MLLDLFILNLFLYFLQLIKFKNNSIFFGHDLLSLLNQVSLLEIHRRIGLVPLLSFFWDINIISLIGLLVLGHLYW